MKIINVVLFIFMIAMNYLANALPLNGKTTGELSAAYPNLFVPAGITFSIWGIIYTLLLIYCVFQFVGNVNIGSTQVLQLFAITSVLNGLWIMAWHYQKLSLSMLIMIGMLVALLIINIKIKELPFNLTKAAFGIYLGWICIATIANATALLVDINWNAWGIQESNWAIGLIFIGLVITAAAAIKLNNPFIGLAVAWAFLGIALKRNADYSQIAIVGIIAMAITIVTVGVLFFKPKLV